MEYAPLELNARVVSDRLRGLQRFRFSKEKSVKDSGLSSVSQAISKISGQPFDILPSDLNIGQPGDGFRVVSAMRRVQPHARTYILTGYPDFASALEAIRRQVDDFLVKPADIPTLVKTLQTRATRTRGPGPNGKRASTIIHENMNAIIESCSVEIDRGPQFAQIDLPRRARIDHLPGVLQQLVNRLDKSSEVNDKQETESAWVHPASCTVLQGSWPTLCFGGDDQFQNEQE